MRPTPQDVHVDAILSGISVMYKNNMYIGDMVAPLVSVEKQSDKYYTFDKADMFRSTAGVRAPGSSSKRHGFTLSTDSYFCDEVSDATQLETETIQNADAVLRMETTKINFITDKILLKFEEDIASLCTTTSNWGSNYSTPINLWDDYENSDFITDMEDAIEAIEGETGQDVNLIVLSYDVWKVLKHHPQLLERMSSNSVKTATLGLLASIIGVPKILIGKALVNSANLGQTASYSRLWTKDVFLGHVAPAPGLETPTALYTFVWPEEGQIRGVRTWREENIHSDIYEAFMRYDAKVVGSDLGYLLNDVIS
jgi:hypothetical protein